MNILKTNFENNAPLAFAALSTFRQAKMIRPPLLARSNAVCLPIPALAPVMITVLPSILFLLLHSTTLCARYTFIVIITTPKNNTCAKEYPSNKKPSISTISPTWPWPGIRFNKGKYGRNYAVVFLLSFLTSRQSAMPLISVPAIGNVSRHIGLDLSKHFQ